MNDRPTASTINDAQLDELYDDLEHARAHLGSALACVRLLKIYAHVLDRDGQVGSSDVARRIRSILTGLDDQAEPPVHIGGQVNAEDCPACTGTNPPYPFICPGPDEAAADNLVGVWTPDPPIRCLTVAAEPDPFGYEERERTGRNAGLVLSAATEATDMGSELDDAAATIANHTVEINQLRHTLDEVLRHFVHKGHPGEPCLQTGWISERTVARWRAVLNPPKEQQS